MKIKFEKCSLFRLQLLAIFFKEGYHALPYFPHGHRVTMLDVHTKIF